MRAHLLNWTLGPALLGAIIAGGGAVAPAVPAFDALVALWRGVVGLAGFFVAFYLVSLVIQIIVHRLNGGRFVGAEVRRVAIVMAVQLALLLLALMVLLTVREVAISATGGWPRSGWAAAVGAVTAAAVGLPMGFCVAQLRLPQRLGLDREGKDGVTH
jgi:hypothetical protein